MVSRVLMCRYETLHSVHVCCLWSMQLPVSVQWQVHCEMWKKKDSKPTDSLNEYSKTEQRQCRYLHRYGAVK